MIIIYIIIAIVLVVWAARAIVKKQDRDYLDKYYASEEYRARAQAQREAMQEHWAALDRMYAEQGEIFRRKQ